MEHPLKRMCIPGDKKFLLWHSEYSVLLTHVWNTSQKKNSCGLTTDLAFNEGDMQYYFEDIYIISPHSINTSFKFTET